MPTHSSRQVPQVAVLCAGRSSVYSAFPQVSIFDRDRSAEHYRGPWPVVAHPPSRFWSAWNARAAATVSEIVSEMMLGMHCAMVTRSRGGVLEQPAHSRLWRCAGFPVPSAPVLRTSLEWSIEVDQSHWGHPHAKSTWLYVSGLRRADLPAMPLSFRPLRSSRLTDLTPGQRSATPIAFARWLVAVAERCACPPAPPPVS